MIRVLQLHPGETGDAINCSLVYCPVNGDIQFDALSYCWGDSSELEEIVISAPHTGGGQISCRSLGLSLKHFDIFDKKP